MVTQDMHSSLFYVKLSYFNHSSGDKFVANIMSLIAVSNPNRSEVELNPYVLCLMKSV